MYLCGKEKDEYISKEMTIPTETAPPYKAWKRDNNMVKTWLINSMTPEVGENFLLYKTASQIWEAAQETYSSIDNTAELFSIESSIYDLKQGEGSVTDYYNPLLRLWHQLEMFESLLWKCPADAIFYSGLVEKKRTFKFLSGLNREFDDV